MITFGIALYLIGSVILASAVGRIIAFGPGSLSMDGAWY